MVNKKIKRKISRILVVFVALSLLSVGSMNVNATMRVEEVMSETSEIETLSVIEPVTEISLEKARAVDILYSGTDGELDWSIDTNGHLTITGEGDYTGYQGYYSERQWSKYSDEIISATVDVSGITSTAYMFYGCSNMISIDLTSLDTSQVKYMGSMFSGCSRLASLNVSNFITTEVEDISWMFQGCSSLKSLDISNFNTGKVTNMCYLFAKCTALEELNLGMLDTSQVTNMNSMFWDCSSLKSVDVSSFNTSRVIGMDYMFYGCSTMKKIDLQSFDMANVGDMNSLVDNCSSLQELIIPDIPSYLLCILPKESGYHWELNEAEVFALGLGGTYTRVEGEALSEDVNTLKYKGRDGNLYWKLSDEGKLTINGSGESVYPSWRSTAPQVYEIDVKISEIQDMSYFFQQFDHITTLDLTNLDTSQVTDMSYMFCGCTTLKEIDMSSFNIEKVENMTEMFLWCESLEKIIAPENKSSVSMVLPAEKEWIYEPTGEIVTEINAKGTYIVKGKNNSNTTVQYSGISGDLVWSIDTEGILTISGDGDFALDYFDESKEAYFPEWNQYKAQIKYATVSVNGITTTRKMFEGCSSLELVDLSNLNTSQVTDMSLMFGGCSGLTSLDMGSFNMSQVSAVDNIFEKCNNLTNITMPGYLKSAVTLPMVENYIWQDNNKTTCTSAYTDLTIPMVYTRVAKISEETNDNKQENNQQEVNNTQNSNKTETKPADREEQSSKPSVTQVQLTPKSVGTKLADIRSNTTYTVTDANPSNPTVAFDGVADENAKAITIPDYVTIDGVKYQVTTVSIKEFDKDSEEAYYKVTDNSVKNLTVEYIGTTNKMKRTISIPENVTYKGVKFKVKSVRAKSFKGNKNITTVKIASSITEIGNSAFEGCTKLKSITIGNNLQKIGKNAFKNCKKLIKITIKSKNLKSVGKNILKGVHAKCKIKVPSKKVEKYQKLFKGKGQKKSVKVIK